MNMGHLHRKMDIPRLTFPYIKGTVIHYLVDNILEVAFRGTWVADMKCQQMGNTWI
jgi:hypothetical protein